MGKTDLSDDERTAARDFVMARLAAARLQATAVIECIDECIGHFIDTDEDLKGKARVEIIEAADACIADVARALQLAGEAMGDIDPEEEEPEAEDEEDDEDDEEPARRSGRRR